jgi:hypothetical protein
MEYHRTKDILYVMQVLGHKNIKNTLLYVQLAEQLFKDHQEFISKVAKTEKDVCGLVEAGFDYVCDFDGVKIFGKSKYWPLDKPLVFLLVKVRGVGLEPTEAFARGS